jgi:L-threonylcarbamoyladenylate synthase
MAEPPARARILPLGSPEGLAQAVAALQRGEIVAFPTDTVYGVGGDALSPQAARRTYEAKGRPAGKGFPVLLATAGDARRLAAGWPRVAEALAERFWPGGLTMVVPARPVVPEQIRTGQTVALRVPGHDRLRVLIAAAGCPLIGTSANRSGKPAALSAAEAAEALGSSVALVLDGELTYGEPSTVVAVEAGGVRLIRAGAVSTEALDDTLRPFRVTLA